MDLLKTEFIPGEPSILLLQGEIDISTAEDLRVVLDRSLAADPRLVVDMAGVTFIDACGLRVVLDAAASLNGARPLRLINARRVARMLQIVGLDDIPSLDVSDRGAPGGG